MSSKTASIDSISRGRACTQDPHIKVLVERIHCRIFLFFALSSSSFPFRRFLQSGSQAEPQVGLSGPSTCSFISISRKELSADTEEDQAGRFQ
jgi:hypothetical protein